MATGKITKTTVDNWIPTHYSPDVILGMTARAVISQLVRRPDLEGLVNTSGKSVKIPEIGAQTARDKVAGTDVTYDQATEPVKTINLDQHKYVAHTIEKSGELQALPALMQVYATQDSRAIAKATDVYVSDLVTLAGVTQNVGATDSAGAYADITDAVIRSAIQFLDEAEAPEENRYLVISPAQKNALLGIDKFVEADKIGDNGVIRTGLFGQVYGVNIYISNNLADTASVASSSGAAAILGRKNCVMFQSEAFGLVVQQDPEVMTEDSVDALGVKMAVDTIFGAGLLVEEYVVQVRTTDES
jgi:N4-gp56 family major capsid protein